MQWEHLGSLTTPRVERRKAPRVWIRALCVDFSEGSSLPSIHGIGLTTGRVRRLSSESLGGLRGVELGVTRLCKLLFDVFGSNRFGAGHVIPIVDWRVCREEAAIRR